MITEEPSILFMVKIAYIMRGAPDSACGHLGIHRLKKVERKGGDDKSNAVRKRIRGTRHSRWNEKKKNERHKKKETGKEETILKKHWV